MAIPTPTPVVNPVRTSRTAVTDSVASGASFTTGSTTRMTSTHLQTSAVAQPVPTRRRAPDRPPHRPFAWSGPGGKPLESTVETVAGRYTVDNDSTGPCSAGGTAVATAAHSRLL
jgi:hypothetical protein